MSGKSNRRKRKALVNTFDSSADEPLMVERVKKAEQSSNGSRLTYEEANWARLSPTFRRAHNRLRQARGLLTIPDPVIDLYVPPKAPVVKPFDPADKEFVTSVREFLGPTMMGGGLEGFTVNGKAVK